MVTTASLFKENGADERSLEFIATAIERNNLPGFDYFEFKRAVYTMLEMKIDEATAFKSAFATAATMGLTKDKLLETASYYRHVVEKEKDQFDLALEGQNTSRITSREEEVKRLRDQVERHKTEIARLQAEIASYLNQIDMAENELKLDAQKLKKAKSSFEKTHQSVLLILDKDLELIHKYIV